MNGSVTSAAATTATTTTTGTTEATNEECLELTGQFCEIKAILEGATDKSRESTPSTSSSRSTSPTSTASDDVVEVVRSRLPFWRKSLNQLDKLFIRCATRRIDSMQLIMTICLWFLTTVAIHMVKDYLVAGGSKLRRTTAYGQPRSFLPPDSPIVDYYSGNGAAVTKLLARHEIVLLLYYAPWSRQSRSALRQMDKLARVVPEDQVHFAAVNCWRPSSECRRHYRMYTFPVLMGYVRHADYAIAFHAPYTAEYMLRFLHHLVSPYEHITSAEGLRIFQNSADTTVVTYIDGNSSSARTAIGMFYGMALTASHSDATSYRVRFGLITDDSVSRLPNVHHGWIMKRYSSSAQSHYRQVTFHLNDGAAQLKEVREMADWAVKRNHATRDVFWLDWLNAGGGSWDKNSHLYNRLAANNSTLLLFAPRSLTHTTDYANEAVGNVRRLANEQAACGGQREYRLRMSLAQESTFHRLSAEATTLHSCCGKVDARSADLAQCCATIMDDRPHFTLSPTAALNVCRSDVVGAACTSKNTPTSTQNECKVKHSLMPLPTVCARHMRGMREAVNYCCVGTMDEQKFKTVIPEECLAIARSPTLCSHIRLRGETSEVFEEVDDGSPPTLWTSDDVADIICVNNRTMNHLLVDSAQYSWIAQNLGLPTATHNSTFALIVDPYYEEVYVEHKTDIESLRSFVIDHARFALTSVRRSSDVRDADLGRSSVEGEEEEDDKVDDEHTYASYDAPTQHTEYTTFIRQINADMFEDVIYGRPTMNILLVHTGGRWSAACYTISHILHTMRAIVDRLLPLGVVDFEIVTIDASSNDLPWHETVDEYPTLIFYPAHRQRANSERFPADLPLTVPNLFAFVLAHAGARFRWRTALALCDDRCMRRNVHRVKMEQLRLIRSLRLTKTAMYSTDGARNGEESADHARKLYHIRYAHLRQQHRVLRQFTDVMHQLTIARAHVEEGDNAVRRYLEEFDDAVRQSTFLQWLLASKLQ